MGRRRKRLPQEPFELAITDFSHDGRGVGHLDGKAIFVHGALPGETIRFRYTAKRRKHDEGVVHEIIKASADRVEPKCPNFGNCGGCALQHLSPEAQITYKQKVLTDNLERIGNVSASEILPPLTAEPWFYRRRARLSARYVHKKERMLVGFRERAGKYVCDMSECHILIEQVGMNLDRLTEVLESLTQREHIPQIEVAAGDDGVSLVIRHMEPLTADDLDRLTEYGGETGFSLFLQPGGLDTIHPLGETSELTFAIPAHDLRLRFEASNFVQINHAINLRMIEQALSLLQLAADETVLDLFCGLGNFSLPMARHCKSVVGVEGDQQLVDLATENAGRNGLDNTRFVVADLTEDHSGADWLSGGIDKVLIDPPRSGAAEVLPSVHRMSPDRIVYVSCHPGSLARDAGILVNDLGYRLTHAGVMDMFPHTAHVESIAVFDRSA